jgi:CheY-like chemotaxis protein
MEASLSERQKLHQGRQYFRLLQCWTMPAARILVIEDNEADIQMLRFALDQQGEDYELETLKDGEEALRFVQEHRTGVPEPEPCLILLDLHLPRYDGIAILHAIRKSPPLEHIKIVVLSGEADPRQKAEMAGLGAFYRRKPFTLTELSELAAEIFVICKGSAPAISS